ELQYSRFRQELERGNVGTVVFSEGRTIEGELRAPIAGEQGPVTHFRTELPVRDSEALLRELEEAGVTIGARTADRDWWAYLWQFLPWLLIIAFWIFIIRQMQAGGA